MRYFRNRQVPVKDAGGNQRAATLAVRFDKTRVCATGYMPESPALSWLHGIQPIPTRIPEAVHYCSRRHFGRGAVFFLYSRTGATAQHFSMLTDVSLPACGSQ